MVPKVGLSLAHWHIVGEMGEKNVSHLVTLQSKALGLLPPWGFLGREGKAQEKLGTVLKLNQASSSPGSSPHSLCDLWQVS